MKLPSSALSILKPKHPHVTPRTEKDEMRAEMSSVQCTHYRPTTVFYRMFMRVYEMVMKTAKREFYVASIASANLHLTQLFRTI